jgi:CRP-like cAMP-binding protein
MKQGAALSAVDRVLCLQNVDIFKHATTEILAYIGSIAEEVYVPGERVIFSEDDISDAMYVVVSGRVQMHRNGKDVLTASSGQSVGTWALFDNQPRMMTATALEDTHLLRIRSDDFYDLLSDHDEITRTVFKAVVERVNRLIAD